MLKRTTLFLTLLFVPVLALATTVFPHDESDLKPDPAAKFGRLDNGVRYIVLPNKEPKGRASVRLAIAAGSLQESESQRGLAHFLEHMSFNGSKHFPPGTLVEFFQRLGMSFGGDTNAFTSFDRTVYMLELPDVTEARFQEAFTYFADVAGGLLLLDAEIDRERGIILSEKRARDSIAFRQFIGEFEFLLPESRFIHRIPIGTEEVISKAPRAEFADFYDTWYRPDLMTVAAVGDFDAALVERKIREVMGPLTARAPARPAPSLGRVVPADGIVAKLLTEPESPTVLVGIQTVAPYASEPDTAANRLKRLPRGLALNMLNRRLSILAKKEGAPFLSGSVGAAEQFQFFRNVSIELTCKPEQWRATLAVADQELRRALQHGFQPAELKEVVASAKNGLDQAVRAASTRRSEGLANELAGSVIDREVFTHPDDELALFGPALDKITVEDCLAALRAAWPEDTGRFLWLTGNLKLDNPEIEIKAAYEASRTVAVEPPAKIEESAFAYTDFGAPGAIARETKVEDLGVTQVEFANGVRANLKPTDFEAGRVRVMVRIGGGLLSQPADQTGLAFFASNTFMPGGLGKHSADDLPRILAGKTVGTNFSVGADAFIFGGTTNRADLLLQLQLICAYLTDPGYRPEALRLLEKNIGPFYARLATVVEGPLQTEAPRRLANGDPRFGLPPQPDVMSRTVAEMKAWLGAEFARGALEIAIVGDYDLAEATAAVARTFGALPPREAKPAYTAERKASFPAQQIAESYVVVTEIPKGIVQLNWPATDGRDARLARRLNLLGSVLQDRLRVKIREEMGDTYSPNAGTNLSDTFTGYGFIGAQAVVDPAKARTVADAMRAAATSLFENGVTEEELTRAKQPALTAIRQSMRTNPYWLGSVLSAAQEQPERLEWARTRLSDTESITAAELSALAKQYLDPAKVHEFLSHPAPKKEN